ncbi:hypothetical protein [Amycolatopsis mediterranei]|nr:hypothetical protein [Amycolatopsis mediterranei]AEK45883.1 hypothetical protein RAM_37070 [Amycolatopsis mediterranei S699]UZF73969.1 hypothetical protein ISP_007444 [Amycolatopsis mediterranei]
MNDNDTRSSFLKSSYFSGANIPGKPVQQLLNPTGRWTLQKMVVEVAEDGYAAFPFTRVSERAA